VQLDRPLREAMSTREQRLDSMLVVQPIPKVQPFFIAYIKV
jgi:hypothetical protein